MVLLGGYKVIMADDLSTGVDRSPINTLERRNSLEKHLQTRPEPQDLKDRHILLDTNAAPALQAAQQELERQKATDSLKKQLEKRPDRDELVERQASHRYEKELEKHMRADSLEHKLQNRPKPEELVKEGILEPDENPLKE
ncbi:putative rpel repeat protein [Phaeomoniella chlamydospora]|uniref:Putative rpel repeat protein n=1 Tax=Phaeomoniella chlamydospora TaxID=158046 RepID=A0A0G2E5J8_PHACM|nr:putative rpel repeat protein [Phaeomoniella chlamydospora]